MTDTAKQARHDTKGLPAAATTVDLVDLGTAHIRTAMVDAAGTPTSPRRVLDQAGRAGVRTAGSLAAMVEDVAAPRAVWLMLPAGAASGQVVDDLTGLLDPGDLVADGGNSDWRQARPRSSQLAAGGTRHRVP